MRGVTGNHIGVIEQDERSLGLGGGMAKSGPQIAASRRVFENAVLDSFRIEHVFVKRNCAHLVPGRIGGVDAQVLLHPLNRQIGILLKMIGGYVR